jgi:hypothetical protein
VDHGEPVGVLDVLRLLATVAKDLCDARHQAQVEAGTFGPALLIAGTWNISFNTTSVTSPGTRHRWRSVGIFGPALLIAGTWRNFCLMQCTYQPILIRIARRTSCITDRAVKKRASQTIVENI